MIPYSSRIPVQQSYVQAVGQVIYNFAAAGWMVAYLGTILDPEFLATSSGKGFDEIARAFVALASASERPEFKAISERFENATARRAELLLAVPITADGGEQLLDGSRDGADFKWTEDTVISFAKELEDLDVTADALYYKLRS